ncbi:MAG TPA: DUF2157 domain-containing protein [Gemmatimonadales bacterium]|jgi:uncharacterized membrane protein
MAAPWESPLRRWVDAGLLDGQVAERIRAWERERGAPPSLRWPAWLALGLGGLLLGAGILLFVAAHWDTLGPLQRFGLVLLVLASLHLAGAAAAVSTPALSSSLHACGTVALGGGIFLSGQIFHLEEHWPGGLFLWAVGAWIGWWLLRQWPQAALGALLTPAWLAGEWMVRTDGSRSGAVLGVFILLTALAYLGAVPSRGRWPAARRALAWLGGLGLLPAALWFVVLAQSAWRTQHPLSATLAMLGWAVAIGLPAAMWIYLRGADLVPLAAAVAWVVAGIAPAAQRGILPYLWCAVLAIGVIAWGLRDRRSERVNLGVAGFALTVLVFYFSDVMDKLGRSASLIGLGLLFLGGGYLLERARRRLVAAVRGEAM